MGWAELEALSPVSQAHLNPRLDEGLEWALAWLEISEIQAWVSVYCG